MITFTEEEKQLIAWDEREREKETYLARLRERNDRLETLQSKKLMKALARKNGASKETLDLLYHEIQTLQVIVLADDLYSLTDRL